MVYIVGPRAKWGFAGSGLLARRLKNGSSSCCASIMYVPRCPPRCPPRVHTSNKGCHPLQNCNINHIDNYLMIEDFWQGHTHGVSGDWLNELKVTSRCIASRAVKYPPTYYNPREGVRSKHMGQDSRVEAHRNITPILLFRTI